MRRRKIINANLAQDSSDVGSTTKSIATSATTKIPTVKAGQKRSAFSKQEKSRFRFFATMYELLTGRRAKQKNIVNRVRQFDAPKNGKSRPIVMRDNSAEGNTVTFKQKFTRAHGESLISPKAAFSMASEYKNRVGADAERSIWAFHERTQEDGQIKGRKKDICKFTDKDVEDVAMVVAACEHNDVKVKNAAKIEELKKNGDNRVIFERASKRYHEYIREDLRDDNEKQLLEKMMSVPQTRNDNSSPQYALGV